MPKTYNIALLGPHSAGKNTIARKLSERYGWKVINLAEILDKTIKKMNGWKKFIPCNPQTGIHLSEEEYELFIKGGGFPMYNMWPIIANQFGIKVMKRSERPVKPKPVDPNAEPNEEEQQAEEPKKKEKKKKKKKKKKRKKRKGEDLGDEIQIEDIPLSELAPVFNEDFSVPPIQGIILVGYPNTKEQMKKLKEFNVKLDKVIILVD